MNGHGNEKSLTSANVLSFDVTEVYHHRYFHMFLMTSLYLVLTSIPILVTLQQPTCHFYPRPHSEDLSSAKATRLLNFIRRNLYNSSKEIKSRAYTLL